MSKNPSIAESCIVNKSITLAWEAYFTHLGHWWSKDMFTSPKTKRFVIEPKLGGLVYEDYGGSEGLVWGTVIGVDKPHSLLIKGTLSRQFGGPATTIEELSFEEIDGKTKVSYHLDFVGVVDDKTRNSLAEGWQMILNDLYKPYCENL